MPWFNFRAWIAGTFGPWKARRRPLGLLALEERIAPAQFAGGVAVAAGDVDGDGLPDLINAAGPGGGPHVQVINGSDGSVLNNFYAFDPSFDGGISIAAVDFNGDGYADIATAAGPGGGPHVRVFSGRDGRELLSIYAYDPTFTGGVNVAAADVTGDGTPELITGAGAGGGPHVKVFAADGTQLQSFYAFAPSFSWDIICFTATWQKIISRLC